jgi:hypothetical protein
VAPSDKKAVYMGYAFLYGVIGSLIGSTLGGTMYEAMLKPLVGKGNVAGEIQTFWLIFAGLGLCAMAGLLLYNKLFALDTPEANARARRVMIFLYGLLLALGIWFLYASAFAGPSVAYRTLVQAVIMLLIGTGGMIVSFKRPAAV